MKVKQTAVIERKIVVIFKLTLLSSTQLIFLMKNKIFGCDAKLPSAPGLNSLMFRNQYAHH